MTGIYILNHRRRLDLVLWYSSGFGSPVARAQGIGYVQELVSRLTSTRISVHNSSTNATLDDNPVTFPFGQSLYVDATHDVVILNSKYEWRYSFWSLSDVLSDSSRCFEFKQLRR